MRNMNEQNNREVGLLDYLLILVKWRRVILTNFLIALALGVTLSLLLPKYYRATATFLPPSQSSGLSALIQNFSFDVLGASDISGEACLAILKSRELREQIIAKYDLMKVYEEKYLEHTLKELDANVVTAPEYQVGIGVSTISSVSLSVIDKSPQRAADMANDFLSLLEARIIELNTKKARNNRIFLEKRVAQNQQDLQAAEDSLRAFQEKYGAIEISAQSKATIEAAAQLKVDILALEMERNILAKNALPSNVSLSKLNTRLSAMQHEYEKFYAENTQVQNGYEVLLPIRKIPALALQYFRALRETEVQNRLYEMLVPLYEQAKIQEDKTIPVLKVIDRAIPPTYKYKPKRAFIVLGIVAVTLIFCLLYVFYREYLENLKQRDAEQHDKLLALTRAFSFRRQHRTSR